MVLVTGLLKTLSRIVAGATRAGAGKVPAVAFVMVSVTPSAISVVETAVVRGSSQGSG